MLLNITFFTYTYVCVWNISDFWSDSYCPCPVQCPAHIREFQAIKTAACQNFVVWLFSCCFLLRFVNWSFLRELFFQVDQILTKSYFVGSMQDGTRDTESVGDCWISIRNIANISQSWRRPLLGPKHTKIIRNGAGWLASYSAHLIVYFINGSMVGPSPWNLRDGSVRALVAAVIVSLASVVVKKQITEVLANVINWNDDWYLLTALSCVMRIPLGWQF